MYGNYFDVMISLGEIMVSKTKSKERPDLFVKSLPGEGGTTNCGESPEAVDEVVAEEF